MKRAQTLRLVVPFVALWFCACAATSHHGSSTRRATELFSSGDYAAAATHFRDAADSARTDAARYRAFVGLGRAQLHADQPMAALQSLYKAQGFSRAEQESEVYRLIGVCYLATGDYKLASNYLLKRLARGGWEREVALAYTSFCLSELGDKVGAARYRRKLASPLSQRVKDIIDGRDAMTVKSRTAARDRHVRSQLATMRRPVQRRPQVAKRQPKPQRRPESRKPLSILPRNLWKPRPRKANVEHMGKIYRLTIHHSAGDAFWEHDFSATAAHIKNIQRFHQVKNRWADIGYHFIVDRTGNVWEGRKLHYQGAHAGGVANHGNIGIVVLGNYTRQKLHPRQRTRLATFVKSLCERYGIPANRVHTHNELQPGHTECPGSALSHFVAGLRRHLRASQIALGK